MRTLRLAALCAAMACCPAFGQQFPARDFQSDLHLEQYEERELVVSFSERVLELRSDGRPSILGVLEARHPELRHAGVDRDGLFRFLVSPEHADRMDDYRTSLSSLGGTVGKTLPSPRLQALYKMRQQVRRLGEPDVLGLMVKYRDGAQRKRAAEAQPLAQAELRRIESIVGHPLRWSRPMFGEAHAVRFETPTDLLTGEVLAQRLATAPDVERVELDTRVATALTPNDEFFALQWNLGTGAGGIRAAQAWDITTGSTNVAVAVVDSGVLLNHPDLAGRLLPGIDTITDPARAQDGDGRDTDPADPGTYAAAGICGTGAPAEDSSWHGTHVSGIIAANTNNGIGIAGVDWRARILPVRSLGRCGSGATADIIDGIAWAAGLAVPGLPSNSNPARVINASLSGAGDCQAYASVLQQSLQRGALVVAAAGNEASNALNYRPGSCALALTVSAVGPGGEKASYSNFHPALEISAPGGDFALANRAADGIASTSDSGAQAPSAFSYAYENGTSQAAPHVAGVLSLMLSVAPTLTVGQMRDTITKTARAYPAGTRCANQRDCGPGILDAPAAVSRARSLNGVRSNYSALWYKSSESGWGLNLQQQGDIVFGTWFTYLSNNNPTWYVMPAMQRVSDDVFSGEIYALTGVPYYEINGQQARRTLTTVGVASVYFFNDNRAFFEVVVNGTRVVFKQLEVQLFAARPTCDFVSGSRAALTNYQDLWWNPSESGWGVNLAHQGDIIFATWFTYNNAGNATWLVADQLRRTSGNTFTGDVLITTGRPAETVNGTPSILEVARLGTMTLTFQNGERGTMTYTVLNTTQTKAIERQVWSTPLSSCR